MLATNIFRRLLLLRPRSKPRRNDSRRNKSKKQLRGSYRSSARKWTKQRCVVSFILECHFNMVNRLQMPSSGIHISLGQTALFKHFMDIKVFHSFFNVDNFTVFQKASDPEYVALMDAQPKPKGRGRKRVVYVVLFFIFSATFILFYSETTPRGTANPKRRKIKCC